MKNKALVFDPQPNPTNEEIMQILKLLMFQSYPPEVRTPDNLMLLFNKMPQSAKRHFQVKDTE